MGRTYSGAPDAVPLTDADREPPISAADARPRGPGHLSSDRPSGGHPLRASQPLYDMLAANYDEHFLVPHRRLYDTLAWERVTALLPPPRPGADLVIDAGCGVGRWASRLLELGYRVIGVEQAPGMVAEIRRRHLGDRFALIEGSMDDVSPVDARFADGSSGDTPGILVLAMGSLQYTNDPEATVRRLASWLAPGAVLAVLVDSLVALLLELLRIGKVDEALERVESARGVWRVDDQQADLHLLDRSRLVAAFEHAGLVDVVPSGLLVSASSLGRASLDQRLEADYDGMLETERRLAGHPPCADVGKHLLVVGRRPERVSG